MLTQWINSDSVAHAGGRTLVAEWKQSSRREGSCDHRAPRMADCPRRLGRFRADACTTRYTAWTSAGGSRQGSRGELRGRGSRKSTESTTSPITSPITVSVSEVQYLTGLDLLPKLDTEVLRRAVASELWPRN